ncbi:hypothetical protein BU26DRAFT_123167 [Trematosphaeria pertusa]|uniref:Uncharacterized protein n=1 Tax=Trematosphaeria pertusa TaxID=390896 RepID=A0A6A6HYK1_9PLEO|nr:uncharacterized protein BU26DRAFT_123167 [Trematosphaeria pertusa]KAF2242969.1 hypothetical protein BU26DRAFT_123167 [Trematosphaeria pertusa]
MPRPKRAKVALTTTRVATTSSATDPAPRRRIVTKARRDDAPKPLESFSDDSDGLVVKSTRPQRRMPWQPARQEDVDLTMTGALPPDNEEDAPVKSIKNLTPPSKSTRQTRASKGSTRGSSVRKLSAASSRVKSRSAQKRAHDAPAHEEDSSGFGDNLLTFTSLDSESPAHGTRPPSAIKVGATPAHETSILALTNFKRRARQPSLLRMVHQTTDVEDNDLDDLGDLDDFHPDAESTPLRVQKSAPGEEAGNKSGLSLSSSSSRGTKRKLSSPVVQVPRSSPPYDPPSGPDVDSRSPSPSLPEVVQSTEEAQENVDRAQPDILSETMAPPMSSSDYPVDEIEDPPESAVRPRQSRRRGTAKNAGKDVESGCEETDGPKKAKGRQKARRNHGISTAKLQALLPRRRTRMPQEDEYDLQSSDDGFPADSDQDELQLPPRRLAPTARKSAAPKSTRKVSRAKKSTTATKPAQENTRTYSRRTSSDKENGAAVELEEDSDEIEETTEPSITRPSATLEAIAKKFEEVDAFEMEFESVSYVEQSSSPWR